ncbi:hypothetical protein BMS3Abin02_00774 [bacterium BMS3Abin02]|nr:hypothetical protein BMS3Abin02_00774 [bacterium BMS3Abin02]GBE23280.1 hypothetical protein BMS3Bbin01_02664 [bacterium BMS3Bbin01]
MSRTPGATVGGQAVIEGVMMRAPNSWAIAVRVPSGEIETVKHDLPRLSSRSRAARILFVRGVMVLYESLVLGFKALSWSAQKAVPEEEEEFTKLQLVGTIAFSVAAVLLIFVLAPLGVAKLLAPYIGGSSFSFNLIDGIVRGLLFVGYIWGIGRSKEIRRVFEYHGAEHQTIHAYEAGEPLTVDHIQKHSPEHPRCGTNFLLIVVFISLVVFTLLGRPGWVQLILSRIVLIPVIAGFAYEVLKFSGLHGGDRLGRVLAAPGLWLQKLTTDHPADDQVEVAVAALLAALEPEEVEEVKARGPVCPAALRALAN